LLLLRLRCRRVRCQGRKHGLKEVRSYTHALSRKATPYPYVSGINNSVDHLLLLEGGSDEGCDGGALTGAHVVGAHVVGGHHTGLRQRLRGQLHEAGRGRDHRHCTRATKRWGHTEAENINRSSYTLQYFSPLSC
jgi:hypothetical protein